MTAGKDRPQIPSGLLLRRGKPLSPTPVGFFLFGANMVQAVASITVPDTSQLSVTLQMTIAEWTQMRDDIQGLLVRSVPLAQMALQLDGIIAKAKAQLGE